MDDSHGIRRIVDDDQVWEVWEAHPRLQERRRQRDRRAAERAGGHERRAADTDLRALMPDAAGWLVFRSERDERRRSPIPPGWEVMPAAELLEVLRRARHTSPFPRPRR